jgi:hypothetical protein
MRPHSVTAAPDGLQSAGASRPTPGLAIGLAHARRGREVFPFRLARKGSRLTKTPLLKWKDLATSDEATIRGWWERWPDAMPGWRLPEGRLVADVDDEMAFAETGLDLPETARQATPSGGRHMLYKHGGGARQTTKQVAGMDTRVGGLGWVGLYSKDSFEGEVLWAPDWLLMPGRPEADYDQGPPEPLGTRGELIALAGGMRALGLSREDIYLVLARWANDGRITDLDPTRPWTAADLKAIAREAGKWAQGRVLAQPTVRFTRSVR